MTDPIADMLTRIRNAYLANKVQVDIPFSGVKHALAEKLAQIGYLKNISVAGQGKHKTITAGLIYQGKLPVVTAIKRVSTPGRRVYIGKNHIPKILSGYGASIISTSQGVLTDQEARSKGLGGEVIMSIW